MTLSAPATRLLPIIARRLHLVLGMRSAGGRKRPLLDLACKNPLLMQSTALKHAPIVGNSAARATPMPSNSLSTSVLRFEIED
jgi:hypothetical protein